MMSDNLSNLDLKSPNNEGLKFYRNLNMNNYKNLYHERKSSRDTENIGNIDLLVNCLSVLWKSMLFNVILKVVESTEHYEEKPDDRETSKYITNEGIY